MRPWFSAGVAGCLLLLGSAPAHADELPAPAGGFPGAPGGSPLQELRPGQIYELTLDGRMVSAGAPGESALFDGGVPLLGGLGGLLPVNGTPRARSATGGAALTGMPPGGTPVADGPAVDEPVGDPRLHEKRTGGEKRSFSDSARPIAGEDEDFR